MLRRLLTLVFLSIALTACTELPQNGVHHDEEEHAELAEAMSQMQYYSQKLGYSVRAENAPLADFYLHELEELSETIIADIPVYEGRQVGRLTQQLLLPVLAEHRRSIEARDWAAAHDRYDVLIRTCNACHQATDHAFIVLTPAEGDPPFNQRFETVGE